MFAIQYAIVEILLNMLVGSDIMISASAIF